MDTAKTPTIFTKLFNDLIWRIEDTDDSVYLTFDDGPIPETTPWVLKILDEFNAKATFFCVGENVSKYPELYKKIINCGHLVGNHTFNHLDGWKTANYKYIKNVLTANKYIRSKLFRPPYGKISFAQKKVLKKHFSIIMWDVLSKDYDQSISPDECFDNVINNTSPGSIIVLHDSVKSFKNLKPVLPKVLSYIKEKGWQTKSITLSDISK